MNINITLDQLQQAQLFSRAELVQKVLSLGWVFFFRFGKSSALDQCLERSCRTEGSYRALFQLEPSRKMSVAVEEAVLPSISTFAGLVPLEQRRPEMVRELLAEGVLRERGLAISQLGSKRRLTRDAHGGSYKLCKLKVDVKSANVSGRSFGPAGQF